MSMPKDGVENQLSSSHAKGEKDFIHDLSTPLGTAILVLDSLLEGMKENPSIELQDVERLKTVYSMLDRLKNLVHSRRETLMNEKP